MKRLSDATSVGRLLTELLNQERYRRLWLEHAERARPGQINAAAVAQALTLYLWEAGLRSETATELPRQLKDRVSRALRGEVLSAETLSWFTHAFGLEDEEIAELWRRFGEGVIEREGTGSVGHRTVSLHELHYLGADGIPAHHETTHVIKALVNDLQHYSYIIDTDQAEVTVERGGHADVLRPFGDGLFVVDLSFHRPLRRGEVASMKYLTHFHYKDAPEPVFRRQARRLVENLELRVQFHRQRCPAKIWWSQWADLADVPEAKRPVALDEDLAVQQYLTSVRNKTVGFAWDWNGGQET
jgi:hypothetical protein